MAIRFKNKLSIFDAQQLEAIARVLGDTNTGLSGSDIGHLLSNSRIPDVDSSNTKWKRLYNAFVQFQNEHRVGNHIIVFVNQAMNPATYTSAPELFESRQVALNRIFSLCGYELGADGKIRNVVKAKTLEDALARSNRLQEILRQRNVHMDVLKYCRAEILEENYFHAVLEAMKSITAKIRQLSDLDGDGAELIDQAFGLGKNEDPILAINFLDTKTRKGEQRGFVSLLKGLYGTIRNPHAHEPKIEWDEMEEQDAADILTMISLVHRKLDKTTRMRG